MTDIIDPPVDTLLPFPDPSSEQYRALCAAIVSDDWGQHSSCSLTACRAPLHPGPCKGWKHTLHQISPGVWHSLERTRVENLNKRRVAAVEKLRSEGKPVPKALLTPIQPRTAPAGIPPEKHGQIAKAVTGPAHEAAVKASPGRPATEPAKVADLPEIGHGQVLAKNIKAGDRIEYHNTPVTILSGPTPDKDRFGREMMAFHGRREDTGKEGKIIFGPTGVAKKLPASASGKPAPAAPEKPAGYGLATAHRVSKFDTAHGHGAKDAAIEQLQTGGEWSKLTPADRERMTAYLHQRWSGASDRGDRQRVGHLLEQAGEKRPDAHYTADQHLLADLARGSHSTGQLLSALSGKKPDDWRALHPADQAAIKAKLRAAAEDPRTRDQAESALRALSAIDAAPSAPAGKPGTVKATAPREVGKVPANPIEPGRTLDQQARANVEKRAAAKLAATPAGPASVKAANGRGGSAATRMSHYRRLTPEEFRALPDQDRVKILRDLDVIHRANQRENPTISAEAAAVHTALRTGTAPSAPSAGHAPAEAAKVAEAAPAKPPTSHHGAPEDRIRQAYVDALGKGEPGDWVSIADIRDRMTGMSRAEQDAALRAIEQRPDVNIVPQANQKALSQRARDAAVRIGGEDKQYIAVIPPDDQPSPPAASDTSHLHTPAGLRAEAAKLEEQGHLVPAAQLTGIAEAVEQGRRTDLAQVREQAARVIENAKTMRVPEWRRAAPKPASTAAPRTLDEAAATEALRKTREQYHDEQRAAIDATTGGAPTTAVLDRLERDLTPAAFRALAPADQERVQHWVTSARGAELGRRGQYLLDHWQGKLEPLTREDVQTLPHGDQLRAEVAKRTIDGEKAAQAAVRAERKASGIPSDAELKKLPPEQRYAAENVVHEARLRARALAAQTNNRAQLDALDATVAAHPDMTPEQRQVLDRLRSNYVTTLHGKAGRIAGDTLPPESAALVQARDRWRRVRAEHAERGSIDTAQGLARAIIDGRIKPNDYQSDTPAERARRVDVYKAADLSNLSDEEKAAVAKDIASLGGPDAGKITAKLGTITHRPTSNPDVLVRETPLGTGHRITVEHNGQTLHQVDTIRRTDALRTANEQADKIAGHLAAGRTAQGETPEDIAKREASQAAHDARMAKADEHLTAIEKALGSLAPKPAATLAEQAKPKGPTPARRGDLVAVEEKTQVATRDGRGATQSRVRLARVTSVTREGKVKAFQQAGDSRPTQVQHAARGTYLHVIPQDQVDAEAALKTAADNPWGYGSDRTGKPYESLAELRHAIAPHLKGEAADKARARGITTAPVTPVRQAQLDPTTLPPRPEAAPHSALGTALDALYSRKSGMTGSDPIPDHFRFSAYEALARMKPESIQRVPLDVRRAMARDLDLIAGGPSQGHNAGRIKLVKDDLVPEDKPARRTLADVAAPHPAAPTLAQRANGDSPRDVLRRAIDAPDTASAAEVISHLSGSRLREALDSIPVSHRAGIGPRSSEADRRRVLVDWATSADEANGEAVRGLGQRTAEQRAASKAQRAAARHAELGAR